MATIFKPLKLEECKVGLRVTYYPVVKNRIEGHDPVETVITSEPWEASGQVIVKVKGISGGVLIKHLAESHTATMTAAYFANAKGDFTFTIDEEPVSYFKSETIVKAVVNSFNAAKLKSLVVVIIAMMSLCSCSTGGWYWHETRHTATGKVSYVRPGWPKDHSCSTYYSSQPVKSATIRRLHFHRNHKRQ